MRAPRGLQERFWSKVLKTETCWLWQASGLPSGYGQLQTVHSPKRRKEYAHRLSWMFTNGAIPCGHVVMHTCDNPRCVRPDHLRLGTVAENVKDKIAKRRHPRGERNSRARFNPQAAAVMRFLHARGVTYIRLARAYDTSEGLVGLIVRGERWPAQASA